MIYKRVNMQNNSKKLNLEGLTRLLGYIRERLADGFTLLSLDECSFGSNSLQHYTYAVRG